MDYKKPSCVCVCMCVCVYVCVRERGERERERESALIVSTIDIALNLYTTESLT